MIYENLKLDHQLCFPAYAASRLIIREYQPYLDKLEITYTQYLVLMILWERDDVPVNDIAKRLFLNTNTITPLLKRMEQQKLIKRKRSSHDERSVSVRLTKEGLKLKHKASGIPEKLYKRFEGSGISTKNLSKMKRNLESIISFLCSDD